MICSLCFLISAFKLPAARCKMLYVAYVFMCLYGKIPVYSTEIFYITIPVILWKSYTVTAVCTAFDLIHDESPAFIYSQHSTPMMPGIRQTYFGTSISIFFSFDLQEVYRLLQICLQSHTSYVKSCIYCCSPAASRS